ncbi:MAG: hypothetical protein NC337_06945 [Roseburia sp.]|nr:hypothetical protein [Roseburia sp.]
MFRERCVRHKYSILFVLFLICFYGYGIGRVYGFTFFPDEFGYWAHAAKAAGCDWSDIASRGSYYSYGYSMILFPIFKLCTDAVTAYRAAVTLNFILIGAVYFMLLGLMKRPGGLTEDRSALCAAVAAFYPCQLFYAKSTLAEPVLVALYAAICVLLCSYLEKNRRPALIGLVVALVYIHFVHMRAVGVLIAGILTLVSYLLTRTKGRRQLALLLPVCAVALAAGFAVKNRVQGGLYTDAALSSINDYAGQLEKLSYIFSREGMRDFAEGLAGKLLYMGLSGFGLTWWGGLYAIKQTGRLVRALRRGQPYDARGFLYVFILLSAAGELLINAIYNIHPLRVDSVVYGRYHEFVFPILMAFGMRELLSTASVWKGALAILLGQLPLTALAADCVRRHGLTNMHGYVMAGMSYMHNAAHFEAGAFLWSAYGFGALLTVVVVLAVTCVRENRRYEFLLTLLLVMELALSARISGLYTDAAAQATYRDTIIADKIEALAKEQPGRRIVYLSEEEWGFIGVLQFLLRDRKIELLPPEERTQAGEDDILILYYESAFTQEAQERYRNHLLSGHFDIYYNR